MNHEERNEKVEIQESAIEASKSIVITIYMMTSVSKCYEFQLFAQKKVVSLICIVLCIANEAIK